jgi:hypothetical protein
MAKIVFNPFSSFACRPCSGRMVMEPVGSQSFVNSGAARIRGTNSCSDPVAVTFPPHSPYRPMQRRDV